LARRRVQTYASFWDAFSGTPPALSRPKQGPADMRSLWIVLFSIAAGFTASGIIANLYRACWPNAESGNVTLFRGIIMIVAGPNVIFEMAVRAFTRKEWSPFFFWLVTAGLIYWSLAIGLFILDFAIQMDGE
jgi:hypothetical protein